MEQTLSIVIDADGKAVIGVFDAVSGEMKRTIDVAALLAEKAESAGTKVEAAAKKSGDSWEKEGKRIGQAVGAVVVGFGALVALQIRNADAAGKMAEKLGVSTAWLTATQYAAKATGSDLETLNSGLFELGDNAAKAAGGNKQASATFKALGIDVRDSAGNVRGFSDLLPELADEFAQMENGPAKNAIALRLFGGSFKELLPLLNQGSAGIEAFREQAAQLGLVIDDEAAAKAAKLNDEIAMMRDFFSGMAMEVASDLLPILIEMAGQFGTAEEKGEALRATAEKISDALGITLKVFASTSAAAQALGVSIGFAVDVVARFIDKGPELLEVAGAYAKGLALMASGSTTIGYQTIAAASDRDFQLRDEIMDPATDTLNQSLALIQENLDRTRRVADGTWESVVGGFDSTAAAAKKTKAPVVDYTRATNDAAEAAKRLKEIQEAGEKAGLDLVDILEEQEASMGPLQAANVKYRQSIRELIDIEAKLSAADRLTIENQELLKEAWAFVNAEHAKSKKIYEERLKPLEDLNRQLEFEESLIGLTDEAREKALIAQRAEAELRAAINAAIALGATREEAEAEAIRNGTRARIERNLVDQVADDRRRSQQGEIDGSLFGGRVIGEGADAEVLKYEGIGDILYDSIVRGAEQGARGFREALEDFSAHWQQLNGAEKTEFVAQTITAVAQFGQQLRDNFERFGTVDGWLHTNVDSAASSGVPVISQIAQAIQAVDGLLGGRLLGTAWEPSSSGRNFSIGAGGVSGSQFTEEERQRSFFRGTARRRDTDPLDPQAQEALEDFRRTLLMLQGQAARAIAVEAPPIIAGSFAEVFNADGELVSQIGTIAGRAFRESSENFERRLLAENLIAVTGVMDETASAIAEHWRNNARDLLDGAQLLLAAQDAIGDGNGLLGPGGTLAETVALIEDLAFAGEPLTDAFARAQTATALYTEALDLMGISIGGSRTQLVRMASDFAEFAGGLEGTASQLQTFFEYFFSPEERAESDVRRTSQERGDALAGLGLSRDTTDEMFRLFLEGSFATASAQVQADWMGAATVLANAGRAQERYNEILEDTAEQLRDIMRDVDDALAELDGLTLEEQLLRIGLNMRETEESARRLGASQAELGRIQLLAARQAIAARAELERGAADLVERLFGGGDSIAAGLAGFAGGISAVREELRGFRDDALLDDSVTKLSVQEQFDEALRQAYATGDDAVKRRALELARRLEGTGADFDALFDLITAIPSRSSAPNTEDLSGSAAAVREQTAAERLRDAQVLAEMIAQLAIGGRSYEDVAAQLDFELEELMRALGLDNLGALNEYLSVLAADTITGSFTEAETETIRLLRALVEIASGRTPVQSLPFEGGKPPSPITGQVPPAVDPYAPGDAPPALPPPVPAPGPAPPPRPGPGVPPRPGEPPIEDLIATQAGALLRSLETRLAAVESAARVAGESTAAAIARQGQDFESLARQIQAFVGATNPG